MKTFLDFFNAYKNDKSVKFSIYYVVKGKLPRVEESDGCTFRIYEGDGKISICRPPKKRGSWMRHVMCNALAMYFGLFKEEDLNTTVLKDNWNYTAKTIYLNIEDAEKAMKK